MSDVIKTLQLIEKGYKLREIAEELDTNISRVKDIVYRRANMTSLGKWEQMHRRLPLETRNRIQVLLSFGYTPREIAEDQEVPTKLIAYIKEKTKKL